jgi:hypothetical protein
MIDTLRLNRKVFVGIVEDNYDPKRCGRVKVRVQSLFNDIPVPHIPWASPHPSSHGKDFFVPPNGKIVNVIFENANLYTPYYIYTDKYNINLQDKLESLSESEYSSFIALLFDHKTQIFSDDSKLTLDFLLNRLTIDKEGINLEVKDNSQRVNLGSKNATQRAVLGDAFILDWFTEFVNILLNPVNMTGNMGAPVLKPALDAHLTKFLTRMGDFVSSNVYIVDNNKVESLERDSATSEVEHDDVNYAIQSPDSRNKNKK